MCINCGEKPIPDRKIVKFGGLQTFAISSLFFEISTTLYTYNTSHTHKSSPPLVNRGAGFLDTFFFSTTLFPYDPPPVYINNITPTHKNNDDDNDDTANFELKPIGSVVSGCTSWQAEAFMSTRMRALVDTCLCVYALMAMTLK